MSNNLRLEVLLKAVDQATRPLKSIQTASKTLSGDIRDTQKGLRDLNGQAAKIDGFRKTSAQLACWTWIYSCLMSWRLSNVQSAVAKPFLFMACITILCKIRAIPLSVENGHG